MSRPGRPTQTERVLAALLESDEVCGSELYRQFIPRFSVAIHRLRQQGYVISKRPCDLHFHSDTAWLYRLEALPEKQPRERCASCGGILGSDAPHTSQCPARRFDGEMTLFGLATWA